jgi:hypothetical protein
MQGDAPPFPKPPALRLVTSARGARLPRPPFGLAGFSDDPSAAVAVLLEGGAGKEVTGGVDAVAAQLPPASDLEPGTLLVVLGEAATSRGRLGRLLASPPRYARTSLCGALLAQGYARIGAGTDPSTGHDLAWGYA